MDTGYLYALYFDILCLAEQETKKNYHYSFISKMLLLINTYSSDALKDKI